MIGRMLTITLAGLAGLAGAMPLRAQPGTSGYDAMRSVPLSAGDWTYVQSPTATEARFGALFLIRCDRATRLVLLQRLAPPGSAAAMTITTDTSVRSFASGAVRLGARDPLLDAIAFSRGRIVVAGGGGAPLILPSWPETARSIEDCRN